MDWAKNIRRCEETHGEVWRDQRAVGWGMCGGWNTATRCTSCYQTSPVTTPNDFLNLNSDRLVGHRTPAPPISMLKQGRTKEKKLTVRQHWNWGCGGRRPTKVQVWKSEFKNWKWWLAFPSIIRPVRFFWSRNTWVGRCLGQGHVCHSRDSFILCF